MMSVQPCNDITTNLQRSGYNGSKSESSRDISTFLLQDTVKDKKNPFEKRFLR